MPNELNLPDEIMELYGFKEGTQHLILLQAESSSRMHVCDEYCCKRTRRNLKIDQENDSTLHVN